ncbi:MAG: alpha/beta fold hydrolase [Williamsia sp.]|nr:alpha/beta fold hydrolase [Williamsia sp.]
MQNWFSAQAAKKIFRWTKVLIILYCIVGFAIYYFQDYFLFHPVPLARNHRYDFTIPHREVNIPYDAASNLNIVQFAAAGSPARGVILYFHGNKKNISWYASRVPALTKWGYEVWMIDYPGFGKSTGRLTEPRLYEYANQLYKLARTRFEKEKILVYGRSMGTGIAAYLASRRDCRRLILETPYYSMHALMSHYLPIYPVSRMIHYRLPTFEYLPKVLAPVTIFHGTSDGVIPYSNAKQLQPLLKHADQFITVEGGSHNDLDKFPQMQQALDSLLSQP